MGRAKDIQVKVIPSKAANAFVKKFHYSGKVGGNSQLHFGCFLDGTLGGVMSFGPPMDKRKVLPLVVDSCGNPCLWNEMMELNRMAFSELLPRNSESRCMAIAFRLLKKNAKHIKWILSFSDGTQCGDGTIYRASGFSLTAVRESLSDLWLLPEALGGGVVHRIVIHAAPGSILGKMVLKKYGTRNIPMTKLAKDYGGVLMSGFQLRYIKILEKGLTLSCPELPYSAIDEAGAGMYKGEKITIAERQQAHEAKVSTKQPASSGKEGGAGPTHALNLKP